jgi:peptidoglycan-associated lipoprotein
MSKTRSWLLKAAPLALLVALAPLHALAESENETPWTTSLGAGAVFFEGDQNVNPGQLYELRQGYDFSPSLTLEANVGGAPFLEEKDIEGGRNGDNGSLRLGLDLLYHLDDSADRTLDPYVGINGGAAWYRRDRETGDVWEGLWGLTAGLGYNLDKEWEIRGEYRLQVAGDDQQINQTALALLSYRWPAEESTSSEAKGTIFDEEGQTKLQTIHFAFDSAKLTDTAKLKLRENSVALGDAKNQGKKVVIEGHCDERGTVEYNMALGQRRANSASEFLRSLGVPAERMSTISFGKEKPVDPGHNEAAWAKNRRAETVVINK